MNDQRVKSSEPGLVGDQSDATIGPPREMPTTPPMPGMYGAGQVVTIEGSTMEGIVIGYHLSDDRKELKYMVRFAMRGVNHERAFLHDELKAKEVSQ